MKRVKCTKCGKSLAELNNHKSLCFAHNPVLPQYEWSPVTLCTGYKADSLEWIDSFTGILKVPGSRGYNERAFKQDLIYPNLEPAGA